VFEAVSNASQPEIETAVTKAGRGFCRIECPGNSLTHAAHHRARQIPKQIVGPLAMRLGETALWKKMIALSSCTGFQPKPST